MVDRRMTKPVGSKKNFLVRGISEEYMQRIKAVAALMGLSINEMFLAAIVEKIENSPYNKRFGKIEKQIKELRSRTDSVEDQVY